MGTADQPAGAVSKHLLTLWTEASLADVLTVTLALGYLPEQVTVRNDGTGPVVVMTLEPDVRPAGVRLQLETALVVFGEPLGETPTVAEAAALESGIRNPDSRSTNVEDPEPSESEPEDPEPEVDSVCDVCGQKCANRAGMLIHRGRKHGVRTGHNEAARRRELSSAPVGGPPEPPEEAQAPTTWPAGLPMLGCADCDACFEDAIGMAQHTLHAHGRRPTGDERRPLSEDEREDRLAS